MKKATLVLLAIIFFTENSHAQDPPVLSSWLRNTNGRVGYNNIPADVQQVRYSTSYVYVNSTGIPAYTIGPWPGNPNVASNQSYVFKIARSPVENTGTKTATGLGAIAFWKHGVPVYNPLDAMSYNNMNIWHQNAVVVEGPSFDACGGHPAPGGRYHNHPNPPCLYTPDSTQHSSVLGYSYDGYPIYGPYAYANANGTGGITRMATSYRTRNITTRTTLPDGTVLTPGQYGPAVSSTYPLGYYVEDYEFVNGLGKLDQYNGRFSVTPEYPAGTYAYFTTVNANGTAAYPYIIGPQYYGLVTTENITTGGHVTVSESVTIYNPPTGAGETNEAPKEFALYQNYPNPFNPTTKIRYETAEAGHISLKIYDVLGKEVAMLVNEQQQPGRYSVQLDASKLSSGVYYYRLQSSANVVVKKLMVLK